MRPGGGRVFSNFVVQALRARFPCRKTTPRFASPTSPGAPGDVDQTFADISRARALLGYDPRVRIQEGIARFADWFRSVR